jgi:hypothetical protein
MGRKKKELKKLEKDDQADRVDLTESIEPVVTIEPVAPVEPSASSVASELIAPAAPANDAVPPAVEKSVEEHAATDFKAKTTLAQDAFRKTFDFVKDQKVLVDAFLVAVSFHVVMFPVLWTAGWALPWPKPPVVTTLIDYDLQEWIKTRKPKNIIEFRDPALNQ